MARARNNAVTVLLVVLSLVALAALGISIASFVYATPAASTPAAAPTSPPPSTPTPSAVVPTSSTPTPSVPVIASAPKPVQQVRVVVVGRGIGGETATYEMATKGIGNAFNRGASGAMGIAVFEAEDDPLHVCGIIEPIRILSESSGVNPSVLGRSSTTSGSPFVSTYKPMTLTTHAMRVNQVTQPEMRCLAKELNISMYGAPWATEYRLSGYRAFNARMECLPNATLQDGFGSTCRANCQSNASRVNGRFESDAGCYTNWGSADLPSQSTSTNQAAYNLWNYDPINNYNQGDFDPEDEWYGWALGYANYYNPTANYKGDGTAYNNASVFPFQPSNTAQDHPRHQCAKFADLYSMYQYYLGPSYARFICNVNYGFVGDCTHGVDPCTYSGSTLERGWTAREYQTIDELFPVGSMTEFCTRQSYLAQTNTKGVAVSYYMGEPVLTIEDHVASSPYYNVSYKKSAFVVVTPARITYADEVIINAPPSAIAAMNGTVRDALVAQPQFKAPQPVGVLTITLHWNSSVPNGTWTDTIAQSVFGSYRLIMPESCLDRVELLHTPYHRQAGKGRAVRVTYQDNFCVENLLALARITDPTLSLYTPSTGFPLDSVLVREQLRELKQVFINDKQAAATFPEVAALGEIPAPDFVAFDYEPNSWFFLKAGTPYSMKQVAQWAQRPLGPQKKVALNNQAWNTLYAGWMLSSVNQTREIMLSMFGAPIFKRADYDARTVCTAAWRGQGFLPMPGNSSDFGASGNDWTVVYNQPCNASYLPNQGPNGAYASGSCDPPYQYDTPALDGQIEYANMLCNEHHPPYAPGAAVVWQGNC